MKVQDCFGEGLALESIAESGIFSPLRKLVDYI
jgi:hypothetical protein